MHLAHRQHHCLERHPGAARRTKRDGQSVSAKVGKAVKLKVTVKGNAGPAAGKVVVAKGKKVLGKGTLKNGKVSVNLGRTQGRQVQARREVRRSTVVRQGEQGQGDRHGQEDVTSASSTPPKPAACRPGFALPRTAGSHPAAGDEPSVTPA